MNIQKLARKFVFKYAIELFDPKAESKDLVELIKDNLAGLYKSFMSGAEGSRRYLSINDGI